MTIDAVLRWLPTLSHVVMTALALGLARGRHLWMAAFLAVGVPAIAATAWQQLESAKDLGDLSSRLAEITGTAPTQPYPNPGETLRQAAEKITELALQNRQLEEKVAKFQEAANVRSIGDDTATKLSDYLRPFGSHRVVISCVPDDVEAYNYANQIVNILKDANWEAQGPEATQIFGTAPAMGISFYVHGAPLPEAAKILSDAFTKFNVPYHGGITPGDSIPNPETVELFVGPKP